MNRENKDPTLLRHAGETWRVPSAAPHAYERGHRDRLVALESVHRRAEALGDLVEAESARRRSDVLAVGSDELTPPPGGYEPIDALSSAMR